MPNINWDEVGKALLRRNEAKRLEGYVVEPLKEIMTPLLKGEKINFPESLDVMLALIFIHLDLLGYLYKGRSSSSNAVAFLREYLGKFDPRYKEVGGLLYHGLRHGLVHLATPKRIQLKDGMILDFSFVPFGKPQDHLGIRKGEEMERAGRVKICRLLVNLTRLYEDLLSAMDAYAEDIRHNQELSDVFKNAFETRRRAEKEADLLGRQYIRDSDFTFVKEQISNL